MRQSWRPEKWGREADVDSNTWKFFESAVKRRPIEILYESPGRELIRISARNAVAELPWDNK